MAITQCFHLYEYVISLVMGGNYQNTVTTRYVPTYLLLLLLMLLHDPLYDGLPEAFNDGSLWPSNTCAVIIVSFPPLMLFATANLTTFLVPNPYPPILISLFLHHTYLIVPNVSMLRYHVSLSLLPHLS